jgi:zinc transport system permease protein
MIETGVSFFAILQHEFFINALIAGFLASIACGVIGTYVVVKKIAFISGGIAHSAFGGIGLGYLAGFNPMIGAVFASLVSAIGIGVVSRSGGEHEDTLIAAMWATGMAFGIFFIGLSPGYAPDLFSYLFGDILFVPRTDLLLMLALDALIVGTVALYYNEFLAITFDEEFATIMNIRVARIYLILLCLCALTVVMLIRVVGVILVIALLTIPAAIARQHCDRLSGIMVWAMVLGAIFTFAGMWVSYSFSVFAGLTVPSGATIILLGSLVYAVSIIQMKLRRNRAGAMQPDNGGGAR